jgi:hypothetical protein
VVVVVVVVVVVIAAVVIAVVLSALVGVINLVGRNSSSKLPAAQLL